MTLSQGECYLSVIVPLYNEESTIAALVHQLVEVQGLLEIIVIDDCSSDDTPRIVRELMSEYSTITCMRHEQNKGKTAAIRTALPHTRGSIVVVQDGDLEYRPREIPELIKPILDGRVDVAYGSRFLRNGTAIFAYPQQRIVNSVLTATVNAVCGTRLTDVETCYKAFRGEVIRRTPITSDGFGFEIEITARLSRMGFAIHEHPITYRGRRYAAGKKIRPSDLAAAFFYVFRFGLMG